LSETARRRASSSSAAWTWRRASAPSACGRRIRRSGASVRRRWRTIRPARATGRSTAATTAAAGRGDL